MQAPTSPEEDLSGDFEGGGWAADYWPEVMEQVQIEAMSEPYDMLFGRTRPTRCLQRTIWLRGTTTQWPL